jgi:hypothetical protein
MKRLFAAAMLLGLVFAGLSAPTEAAPKGVPSNYYEITNRDQGIDNAEIWVAPTAELKKGGFAVVWDVAFICPRGEKYTLSGQLGDLNPASVPPLQDGDRSIDATLNKPLKGTCTGKVQRATLHLYVRKASWPDTEFNGQFYPAGSGWFPLKPDTAETSASINGDGFSAGYSANVGAITTADDYVRFV